MRRLALCLCLLPGLSPGLTYRDFSQRDFVRPPMLSEDLSSVLVFHAPMGQATGANGTGGGAATFTRATVATRVGPTGTVDDVASGAARFEERGYLNEGARTNLCLQSEAWDAVTASWVGAGSGGGVDAPVVTADSTDTTAPDGTTNSEKIVMDEVTAGAGKHCFLRAAGINLTSGVTYTWSVYLRTASGTYATYLFSTDGGTGTPEFATAITVTTTPQRFTLTFVADSTAAWYNAVGCDTDHATMAGGQAAGTIYGWGGTLEAGAFASSYIPTVAATVTRNADQLTYTSGNLPATVPLTVVADVDTAHITTAQTFVDTRGSGNFNGVTVGMNATSDPTADMCDADSCDFPLAPTTDDFAANTRKRVVATYGPARAELFTDGVSRASDVAGTPPASHTRIAVGQTGASAVPAFGHVQNLMVFGAELGRDDLAGLPR